MEKCSLTNKKFKKVKNKKRLISKLIKNGKISNSILILLRLLKYRKKINLPLSKLRHYKPQLIRIEKNTIIWLEQQMVLEKPCPSFYLCWMPFSQERNVLKIKSCNFFYLWSRGKVIQNEIFKPQGVILLQNNVLQEQIESILKEFIEYGEKTKSEKLNFKLGRLDKEGHTHGDIIICQAKSFLNRHQRGNMNLEQCKFVAID